LGNEPIVVAAPIHSLHVAIVHVVTVMLPVVVEVRIDDEPECWRCFPVRLHAQVDRPVQHSARENGNEKQYLSDEEEAQRWALHGQMLQQPVPLLMEYSVAVLRVPVVAFAWPCVVMHFSIHSFLSSLHSNSACLVRSVVCHWRRMPQSSLDCHQSNSRQIDHDLYHHAELTGSDRNSMQPGNSVIWSRRMMW